MSALLDVGLNPYDFGQRAVFAARWAHIFMAEGIHPNYVKEMQQAGCEEGKGRLLGPSGAQPPAQEGHRPGGDRTRLVLGKEDKKPQIEAFRRGSWRWPIVTACL
jgi:hypothetical protein